MTPPSAHQDFAQHCGACTEALRESIAALYRDVGADPVRPQEVARRFRLNKNLTWKISKVLQAEDPIEAVPLVPGAEGMEILLAAFEANGAGAGALAEVRARLAAFHEMVEVHVGDRPTLELLMDGMSRGPKALEVSRKLAFRGNSGIWGLQARVRSMAQFVAPAAGRPDMLDMAIVGGWHEIRRLRSVQGWPLFRFHRYGVSGPDQAAERPIVPVEPPAHPDEPLLIMRSFCAPVGAEVRSVRSEGGVSHELVDGPIGRRGAVTFVFGKLDRALFPRHAAPGAHGTDYGEMSAQVTMPAELAHVDVLVHRDLEREFRPELVVYGRPFGGPSADEATRENHRLPIDEPIERFDPAAGGCACEHLPDWDRLVHAVFARAGWDARDFVGHRVVVPYPPMPSSVMVRYRLPRAP